MIGNEVAAIGYGAGAVGTGFEVDVAADGSIGSVGGRLGVGLRWLLPVGLWRRLSEMVDIKNISRNT